MYKLIFMKPFGLLFIFILLTNCSRFTDDNRTFLQAKNTMVIAFGSCNNQMLENPFWQQLTAQKPDVWLWGGDIIYSDTENMDVLQKNYELQAQKKDYQDFIASTQVMATWDDHDYGMNDGGNEYVKKVASQQVFLDFLEAPKNDIRRQREGVYYSRIFQTGKHLVKIIMLDTRYFRTALTPDPTGKKRYIPQTDTSGTILGNAQWKWLEHELNHHTADFTLILSSIQILSSLHGFESWGNMPHEVEKLKNLIAHSKTKRVILLSGDRHISEISLAKIGKDSIPLIDFTSSGLTHSYTGYSGEENPYRVGEVVFQKSYGLIRLHFDTHSAQLEMWGENNQLLQSYVQKFD